MPQFLDQYVSEIKLKGDGIRQRILYGRVSALDDDFEDLTRANWRPLPSRTDRNYNVLAVDGSRGRRFLPSGAVFYVVRALGVRGSSRFRFLEADAFLSSAKSRNIDTFLDNKMEWAEFNVAMKGIAESNSENDVILMDGSLFGRMMHIIKDSPAEGQRDFILNYFRTYVDFLSDCRERGIIVIGVSKDSRASFLRDYFLQLALARELIYLSDELEEKDRDNILELFKNVRDIPINVFQSLTTLKDKYGPKLSRIESIFYEAVSARPDHQLIRNFVESSGYTTPMEF